MAGCFGNHPVDKHLEGELNRHLSKEDEYDKYVEKVCDEIEVGNEAMDDFLNSKEADTLLESYYPTDNYKFIAEKIKDAFLNYGK